MTDVFVAPEARQELEEGCLHVRAQRVAGLGAVEGQHADPVEKLRQELLCPGIESSYLAHD